MTEYFLELDKQFFLYLNNLGNVHWDWFWLFITNKWGALPLYALLLGFLYKKFQRKQFVITLILIALLITCTDQTANIFKNYFERLRPCNFPFDDRTLANCGRYGFFSAHAASAMAFAIFIGTILKPFFKFIRPILLIWAILVGYSRIYVGVHFPGDVLVGFLIGCLYGNLFLILKNYLNTAPFLKGKTKNNPL